MALVQGEVARTRRAARDEDPRRPAAGGGPRIEEATWASTSGWHVQVRGRGRPIRGAPATVSGSVPSDGAEEPAERSSGLPVDAVSRDHLRQWCGYEQEIAMLREEIDRLRSLVLTAVDVLGRAERQDEAGEAEARARRTLS